MGENKTIDVIPAILSGTEPEYFNAWATNKGLNVVMPSADEAFEKYKDKFGSKEEFQTFYDSKVNPYYKAVKNKEWVSYDLTEALTTNMGRMWDDGYKKLMRPVSIAEWKPGLEMKQPGGLSIPTSNPQLLAEQTGKFISIDGKEKDISSHSIFDGTVLEAKQHLNTGDFYYQEVPIHEAKQDFRGVFGPTPLTKSWDSARAIYNLLPSLISDLGHLAEVGIELGTALQADEDWTAIKGARAIQNIGSSLKSKADEDNLSGIRAYDVANGIGQLAEMVAVGWLTGSIWAAGKLSAEGSKLGLQAYRSGIGAKIMAEMGEKKAIEITSGMAKVAKNASLFTGAISAAGPWKEQARAMGIPDNDAALMYLGIAAITTAVEAGIGPNKFLRVFDKELVGPSMETVAKTYLKQAQAKGFGSIKELFKADRKEAIKMGLQAFKSSMDALSGKISKLETIPGGAIIQGGLEEGSEEVIESSLHTGLQATYDFIAPFLNEKAKRGLDLKTGNGLFGSNYSDMLNFDPKEFWVGAIAGAVGGGFMGNTKAKNEATKHITKVFAEQGEGAAKLLKDQIVDALNLVKAGKSSWLEQTYITDQGAIKPDASPVERAQANAQVLMDLVDMVDNVFQGSDLKTIFGDVRTEEDMKRRAELTGILEEFVIPEALLGGTAELVYSREIAALEKSDSPDKAAKIEELQAKIEEAKAKGSLKYNRDKKRSPFFDVLFNDVYAKNFKNSEFNGEAYANLTPNQTGYGMFERVLAMEKDKIAYNERIREHNAEIQERMKQGDAALSDFASKLKDYNFDDSENGNQAASQALEEINRLLSVAHSPSVKQSVLANLQEEMKRAGLMAVPDDVPEEVAAEMVPYKDQFDALSEKRGEEVLPEINTFDMIGFIRQQQTPDGKTEIIDWYGNVDDFIAEIAGKTAQTLTAEDVEIANQVERMLDMNETLAAASVNVWGNYDTQNKVQKLQSLEYDGVAHTPYTVQQLVELKEKNKARKQAVQEVLTEYFKNRVGDVVLSGKMQSAYLQKERDILTTILRSIELNDLATKAEGVTIPKEDTITDKNIPDLNRAEKELLDIQVTLWETGDIDKIRTKKGEIMKSLYPGISLNLFEYSSLGTYTDAYRYDMFKSDKGKWLAAMFTVNYLQTLTAADPRLFYKSYDDTFTEGETRYQNFEQRMVTRMAYSFLKDADFDWTRTYGKSLNETIFPNVLTIRGLARTGKSTEVVSRVSKTFKAEHGRPAKVFIFAPNDHLKALHKEELGQHAEIEFAFTDQVSSITDLSEFDFVVFDEASLITEDRMINGDVAKMLKSNKNKPFLFLGDDTQVVGVPAGEDAPNYVPSFSYTIKTPIMTFRYATGNQDIWNTEEKVLKSITTKHQEKESISFPNTIYTEDKTAGVQQFKNSIEVTKEFQEDFERADPSVRKDMVLVVKDLDHRKSVLATLAGSGITEEHVRPIEYVLEADETGKVISRPSIQGGRRPRVYIALDENKSDANNIRAINTAIGRSSGFIAMVGNGISTVGNSIDIRQGDPDKIAEADKLKRQNHDNLMEMLRSVTGNVKPTTEDASVSKIRKAFKDTKENTVAPTETNKNYVVNGQEMQRVHDVMSNQSSENAGNQTVKAGQPEAVLVGNFFDKQLEQMAAVAGDRAAMKKRVLDNLNIPQKASIGGTSITATIEMSEEDVNKVLDAFEELLNGSVNPELTADMLITQPIVYGEDNGKKFAGTLDFAWIKGGRVSKIDVKTFQPSNGQVNPMTISSWEEQMGKYENGLVSMGIPTNNETFIFAIPVERSILKDGKIIVKVVDKPSLMAIDTAKNWKVKESGKEPVSASIAPTQTITEPQPPILTPNESFVAQSLEGNHATAEIAYQMGKLNGNAIMFAQSYFPILTKDAAISGSYSKETSIHTKLMATAIDRLNAEQKVNNAFLKLEHVPDVTKDSRLKNDSSKLGGVLEEQRKFMDTNTVQSILVSLDTKKNREIAEVMAKEFVLFGNKTGFKGGSIDDAIRYMEDNGFFVLGQLYSFNSKYGATSVINKDLKTLFEKMAVLKNASVKQSGETPSGQKSFYGKTTNLAEFAKDVRSRSVVGGKLLSVNLHTDPNNFRYFVNYNVIGNGPHISAEVNGIDVIANGVLNPDIQASINSLKNNEDKDNGIVMDKEPFVRDKQKEWKLAHVAYDTFLQNMSRFIDKAASIEASQNAGASRIVSKPGMEKFATFFTVQKGDNGNWYVNPNITRKEGAIDVPVDYKKLSKKDVGAFLERFYKSVLGTKVPSKEKGFLPLEISYAFKRQGAGNNIWIPESEWQNMVVLSGPPALPRIAVEVSSVLSDINNNTTEVKKADGNSFGDSMFFSKKDAKPAIRKGADTFVNPAEPEVEAEIANINTVEEFDEFGLVNKKRIYMATNTQLSEAYAHNSDAVGYFISVAAQFIRYYHPNGMNVHTKINPRIVNTAQVVYEALNRLKSSSDFPGIILQKKDFIRTYKQDNWEKNAAFLNSPQRWAKEVANHERIWGKIIETGEVDKNGLPEIQFDGNGLWSKVHDPNGGFNTLTESEARFYNAYMLTSDKYFYAAAANIYPGFRPDSNEVKELEIRYESSYETEVEAEREWKRDYNNGNLSFDASNTMTKTMLGHVRSMVIQDEKGRRPVPIKKFQFILLQAASSIPSTLPNGIENTRMNSFYQALWNEKTINPGSENAAIINAFERVFGMPHQIKGVADSEFKKRMKEIYLNGSMMYSYYDMAFNTDIIKAVMQEEGAEQRLIDGLEYRKKVAKQAITHMANYILSVNMKRISTFSYENDAFRMKSMSSLDKSEVERQMYENLAKHIAYGDNGFYISNKTKEAAEGFTVAKIDGGYQFSFKGEQPYFSIDKKGNVQFRKGSETVIFRKMNNFLQLGLHRNFYKAFSDAKIFEGGREIETGKAKIENMIGSMAVTLANAVQRFSIKDIESKIANSEKQIDKKFDAEGNPIADTEKWNQTILSSINELKAKKAILEEQLKITDELVKKYVKVQQLVSEKVKRTVAEIDTETDQMVEREVSETVYLPSGFVGYIRDIAHVQSSLRSNISHIRTRNAAGNAISATGLTSRTSSLLPRSDVGSSFSDSQSSMNIKEWRGLPNNPISSGLFVVSNPTINGGVKNDYSGRDYSGMTTNDFVRSAVDAWVESVTNEGDSQRAIVSLTPNGESSEHTFVQVQPFGNTRIVNYTIEKVGKENIKRYYITDNAWNLFGESVKQLINQYKEYQQKSYGRWEKMMASIPEIEQYLSGARTTKALENIQELMKESESGYEANTFVRKWVEQISQMNQQDLNDMVKYARLFLYENVDFIAKTDANGNVRSFLPGNDFMRANVDLIIQRNSLFDQAEQEPNQYEKKRLFSKARNINKKQPFYTAYSEQQLIEGNYSKDALQKVFAGERYQYFQVLQSNAKVHPAISKSFADGVRPAFFYKTSVNGKVQTIYNPVYEAHFFTSYLINMSFGDKAHGTLGQFPTILRAGKRMKNLNSPGNALALGEDIPGNISKMRAVIVHDGPQTILEDGNMVPLKTKDGTMSSNRSNGAIYYSPLAYIQIHRAMGSNRGNNGQLTKGPLKPLSIDMPDGVMRLLKHAGFVIDEHELIESPEMLDQFKRMTKPSLFKRYTDYVAKLKEATPEISEAVAVREALELVVDDIENNPELQKDFVSMIVPIDAIKTGIKGVVNWWSDIPRNNSAIDYKIFGVDETMDSLAVQEFDLKNYLIQQQASEKVKSPDASFAAQYFETLGGLGEHATNALNSINQLRADNINEFWQIFQNMTENPQKLKEFVRNLALENLSGSEHETMSQYLLSKEVNSLSLPNIAPKVREYFRNYTNQKADKARISGMSAIQMPGWMRKVYEFQGMKMGYKDLVRLLDIGVIDEKLFNNIKINAQPMRAFRKEGDEMVMGQIVAPFMHREKLQMPKGITPLDVFAAIYESEGVKTFIDLRGKSAADIAVLLTTGNGLTNNYSISRFVPEDVLTGKRQVTKTQLDEYAQQIFDFIQTVDKLNKVMLVRTPSGPSSAGWYEMVDWTEREYNMIYVPSEKSDTDSTDFDYDMIGVISYNPEMKEDLVPRIITDAELSKSLKEHTINTARRYNKMLDIAQQLHFDTRNYDFISEPIRLKAYEDLAEERRDKYKFINPHNFAAGAEMRKEFTAGKRVVGYEANNQKVLGVLLNAMHFMEDAKGLLNVTNNVRQSEFSKMLGETNIGRLQNFVNLATDNPNILAMYGLNINVYTSGIYFAMMLNQQNDLWMNEQDTESAITANPLNVGNIIEFMNKDHIRNFFQRIDNSRGVNSKTENVILALNDKIEKLRKSYLAKKNEGISNSDIEGMLNSADEGYTEETLNRFKADLKELKTIKKTIEETGVSYMEALGLTSEIASDPEFEEQQTEKTSLKTSEEIRKEFYQNKARIEKDLAFVQGLIDRTNDDIFRFSVIERLKDFETLLHYAKQAEALRRVGVIVSFNQGKPTEDKEVYRKYNEVKFILGADLNDFLNEQYGTYDYMRNFNDLTEEEYITMKPIEEEVRSFVDFPKLVNALPQLRAQLHSFNQQVQIEKKIFGDYNPAMEAGMTKILELQKLDHYKYSDAYFKFMKENGKFMKDIFYEHEYHYFTQANKAKFDFIKQQNAFLSQIAPEYYFDFAGDYSLSNPKMAKLFAVQTIAVVQWLEQQIADSDSGINVTQAENNFFLANLKTGSNGFLPYIYSDGSMNLDEGVKGKLRDGFKSMGNVRIVINDQQYNIGAFLKQALEHYQFITHGFDISRASLNQVIQGAVFEEFSDFIGKFGSAFQEGGKMSFAGVDKEVTSIPFIAAMQIPLSSAEIVSISKSKADKMTNEQKPYYAYTGTKNKGVKVFVRSRLGENNVHLSQVKNIYGPVGNRYTTITERGSLSNIKNVDRKQIMIYGASMEAYMNIMKGNYATLSFVVNDFGFDTMELDTRDVYIDGIKVNVLEATSTQLVVKAISPQQSGTASVVAIKFGADKIAGDNSETIKC